MKKNVLYSFFFVLYILLKLCVFLVLLRVMR